MDQPTPHPGNRTPEIAPFLLTRDYEDRLDWLENQRRDRTKGRQIEDRKGGVFLGVASLFVAAFAFAGAILRRR